MALNKQAIYLITIVLCLILQAGIAPAISIAGCSPNFLFIPVLLVSFRSGMGAGGITGFFMGLVYDLMGNGTVGCMALVFTITALLLGLLSGGMDFATPLSSALLAAFSSLFVELLYAIVSVLTSSEGGGAMSTVFTYSLPSALYTAVFAVIALLTIGLFIADESTGMPARLGERRGGARKMPHMKSRLK
jgi:rod shape-determining protein MreD